MRGDTNFKGSDSSDPTVYSLYCDAIDIYLSGLLAIILVDWKHAWQIEADEYESDC